MRETRLSRQGDGAQVGRPGSAREFGAHEFGARRRPDAVRGACVTGRAGPSSLLLLLLAQQLFGVSGVYDCSYCKRKRSNGRGSFLPAHQSVGAQGTASPVTDAAELHPSATENGPPHVESVRAWTRHWEAPPTGAAGAERTGDRRPAACASLALLPRPPGAPEAAGPESWWLRPADQAPKGWFTRPGE